MKALIVYPDGTLVEQPLREEGDTLVLPEPVPDGSIVEFLVTEDEAALLGWL